MHSQRRINDPSIDTLEPLLKQIQVQPIHVARRLEIYAEQILELTRAEGKTEHGAKVREEFLALYPSEDLRKRILEILESTNAISIIGHRFAHTLLNPFYKFYGVKNIDNLIHTLNQW